MDQVKAALLQAKETAQALDRAKVENARLLTCLEQCINGSLTVLSIAAQHRAEHRMGRPSLIDTDLELQAFILERIHRMTYKQIVTDIAAHFPKSRQTSLSSV